MKDIMARASSTNAQGVPSFDFNPIAQKQKMLFEYSQPIDELAELLLSEYKGQTLTMNEIFERHNIGRSFVQENYKDALKKLELDNKIITDPPFNNRQSRNGIITFADDVKVIFPKK